jgi:AcrR family transcriptional regulator
MPADNGPENLTTNPADTTADDRRASIRARILDAATEVFAIWGLRDESVQRVAQDVGITRPTLLRYFSSAERLYAEVVARESARLLDVVRPAAEAARPLADVLAGLVAALFEYVDGFSTSYQVLTKATATDWNTVVDEVAQAIKARLNDAGFVVTARTYAHAIAGTLLQSAADWAVHRTPGRREIVGRLTDFILNGVSLTGTVDLVIYTSADDGTEIRDAMLDLLETAGWAEVRREQPVFGSWFQRIWLRGKENGAVDKLNDVAAKLERSLTLKHIGAPRAENDEREAAAIERLAKATENVDEVAIKTSSILFVKHQGQMVVRVLTEAEIAVIDKHPELMRQPAELLASLNEPQLNRSDAP